VAKAAEGTPVAQLRLMLQALLAERFHLVLHRETREMALLALTSEKRRDGLRPAVDTEGPTIADADRLLSR
jgi:uncharacterized protein (TIGR03435 family)